MGHTALLWAGKDTMEYNEGLVHGSPTSSSGLSYTIHEDAKRADVRLVECGGCARFGMDDGYMIGLKEVVFEVLSEFAKAIEEKTRLQVKCEEMQDVQHQCKHVLASEAGRLDTDGIGED